MNNILIIDDHEIISEGIIHRIKKVLPDANCLFAKNVQSAYAIFYQNKIDLTICDLEFDKEPQHDGFYIIEKILELEPRAKIIAHTHYNSYRIMRKVQTAGFMSYLNKGCSFEDFKNTISNVLQHGVYQSETERALIRKRQVTSRSIFNESLQGIYNLSKRELELTILSANTTDRLKLAKIMGIKAFTVDTHFKNIKAKLSLTNRTELAIFALDFMEDLKKLNTSI